MRKNKINEEAILKIIKESLISLLENDRVLIKKKVKEESINHRFACYLEKNFVRKWKRSVSVDLEYNKSYNIPKYIPKYIIDGNTQKKSIRPDIIVHIRNSHDFNLIAFEIKKGYTDKNDLSKIKNLFKPPYKYHYGCLLSYLPDKDYMKIKFMTNNLINRNKTKKYKFFKDNYRLIEE